MNGFSVDPINILVHWRAVNVVGPDGSIIYSDRPPAEARLEMTMTFENLPSSPLPASTPPMSSSYVRWRPRPLRARQRARLHHIPQLGAASARGRKPIWQERASSTRNLTSRAKVAWQLSPVPAVAEVSLCSSWVVSVFRAFRSLPTMRSSLIGTKASHRGGAYVCRFSPPSLRFIHALRNRRKFDE